MPRTVVILAFDDMEVLDFAGPYEVFNVAAELSEPRTFEVGSIGLAAGPVVGRGGFTVRPDWTLDDAPSPDVLVIPGGLGVRRLLAHERLLAWLREQAAEVEVLLSVCTGSLVLAAAGLLSRRSATTHHTAYDELTALDPTILVERGRRFVQSDQRLWTSGGVSAGVDLSLRIVADLAGDAVRDATVAEMEWGWGDGPDAPQVT